MGKHENMKSIYKNESISLDLHEISIVLLVIMRYAVGKSVTALGIVGGSGIVGHIINGPYNIRCRNAH